MQDGLNRVNLFICLLLSFLLTIFCHYRVNKSIQIEAAARIKADEALLRCLKSSANLARDRDKVSKSMLKIGFDNDVIHSKEIGDIKEKIKKWQK